MKIRFDESMGFLAGIFTACIIGKYYIVPWMGWWEVLWIVLKGQVGAVEGG